MLVHAFRAHSVLHPKACELLRVRLRAAEESAPRTGYTGAELELRRPRAGDRRERRPARERRNVSPGERRGHGQGDRQHLYVGLGAA